MNNGLIKIYNIITIPLMALVMVACSGGDSSSDDTTPDAFVFADETEVALGELVISEPIEIEGINQETEIIVEGGEYSINGAAFTDEEGAVVEGDLVYLSLQASEEIDTESEMLVTIGGVEDTFTIRTEFVALVARSAFKALEFSWGQTDGADYYRLLNKPDTESEFEQVGRNVLSTTTGFELDISVHLLDWYNSEFQLETCTNAVCSLTDSISVFNYMLRSIGYIKSPNTDDFDRFGTVQISADGNTMVVGAPGEDGGSKGLNGDLGNNALSGSGAVYVYAREDGVWNFQAYIKAPNADASDAFGSAVAISLDGNTLAVGAPSEDGGNAGVGGDHNDNSLVDSGAVFLYRRVGAIWTLQNYIKSSHPSAEDKFGEALALSAFGSNLVVGVKYDDGEQDNPASDALTDSGAAYVFSLIGDRWEQTAYLKAPNLEAGDEFASSVSISSNSQLIVASTQKESSSAEGVNGSMILNDFENAGAAYTFTYNDDAWSFDSYLKASNTRAGQLFGASIALSQDGTTIAVGAPYEASIAIGVDGDQVDTSNPDSGAAYLFKREGSEWVQRAYIKSSNGDIGDVFGSAVALNWEGDILAVSALGESSLAEGVSGNQEDNSKMDSGAVYVYRDSADGWEQEKYVKAPNTDESDLFGSYLSLDSSGNTLTIGAPGEKSSSNLFEEVQTSNSRIEAGAVYLY